jgi:hypothetical protein
MIRQALNCSVSEERNLRWRWAQTTKRAHLTRPLCGHHSCSCMSRTLCWISLASGGAVTLRPGSSTPALCMISPATRSCPLSCNPLRWLSHSSACTVASRSSLRFRHGTTSTTFRRTYSTLPPISCHQRRRRLEQSLTFN